MCVIGYAMEFKTMDKQQMFEGFFNKRLITSKKTRQSYKTGINKFFEVTQKDICTYVKEDQTYEKDIGEYFLHLKNEKFPLKSIRTYMNGIKQFLKSLDRATANLEIWETVSARVRGAEKSYDETPLDKYDLNNILTYSNDVWERAVFTMMASTGCRIGELTELLPQNVHNTETPTRIVFRSVTTKGERMRTAYISDEAKQHYNAWMKQRDEWLRKAVNNARGCMSKDANDRRVFPMSQTNIRNAWNRMVKLSGLNETNIMVNGNKKNSAHPHCLRKFFRSYLGNVDLAEHIMGHRGYLSTYRHYNEKQLAKEYVKYMENVTIFGTANLRATNERVAEQQKEMDHKLQEKDQQVKDLLAKQEMMETRMQLLEMKLEQEKMKEEIKSR